MNLDKTKSLELDKDDSNNYQWGLLDSNEKNLTEDLKLGLKMANYDF